MNCSFQKLLPNNIAFRNKKIGKQMKEKIKAGSIGERACYTVFAYIYIYIRIRKILIQFVLTPTLIYIKIKNT